MAVIEAPEMLDNVTAILRRHLSLTVLLIVLGMGVAQALYFRAALPTRVASHFNASGKPDGWMSRDGFVKFQCSTLLAMGALFGFARQWLAIVPVSLVNLPNKEFWLAPERRAQSMAVLAQWMQWTGAAMLGFLMALFQFTVRANLGDGRLNTPAFLTVTGIFLTGVIAASIRLYWRFRLPVA